MLSALFVLRPRGGDKTPWDLQKEMITKWFCVVLVLDTSYCLDA